MTVYDPGTRLSFDGALCTVRYFGPLPDQKGDWLGVEWDDEERGKHDGQYKGKRVFDTLSSSPSCASFIRATRVADEPRSFVQALRYKYAEDGPEQATIGVDNSIEISGKVVEEVGFERIRKQQAMLHELKIVALDGLRIRGIGAGAEAEVRRVQEEIASTCPNIVELDLSRNLFEHWKEILDICAALRKLRLLKASGLRLGTFHSVLSYPILDVQELHLNDCLLKPNQILSMVCKQDGELLFPKLSSLSIAANKLSTFNLSTSRPVNLVLATVKTLAMDMNAFTSLIPLCRSLMTIFPNLATLSLEHNQISTLNGSATTSGQPTPAYSSVTTLNLSHNAIATPTLISSLLQLFPNLTSLRVSGNPFFTNLTKSAQRTDAAAFMLTVARLPTLTTLNYSLITDKDRMEAELYYLSVAEKEFRSISPSTEALTDREEFRRTLLQDWPRYHELCDKYDREDVLDRLVPQGAWNRHTSVTSSSTTTTNVVPATGRRKIYPPNTLGARLISITFQLHPPPNNKTDPTNGRAATTPNEEAITLTVPRTLDVYRLKSLLMRKVGRQWGLRPLGFMFRIVRKRDGGRGAGNRDQDGPIEAGEEEEEEEEIPDSTRRIGDWIPEQPQEERGWEDDGEKRIVLVRVKPRTMGAQVLGEEMDLSRLMSTCLP